MTSDLQNGQTKVDILTRNGVPLDLGDRQFRVKPRNMRRDREWVESVVQRVVGRLGAFMGEDLTIPTIIAALGESTTEMLDLSSPTTRRSSFRRASGSRRTPTPPRSRPPSRRSWRWRIPLSR